MKTSKHQPPQHLIGDCTDLEKYVLAAKKCDKPKLPATNFREEKLKKIHKSGNHSHHLRKPARPPLLVSRLKQAEQPSDEDLLRELFKRVYRESCSLDSIKLELRIVEQSTTPDEIFASLMEGISWGINYFRSRLSICCLRTFNNTLNQGTNYVQDRRNLLGLLHTIYQEFTEIISRNQLAVCVVYAIADINPVIKYELEQPNKLIEMEKITSQFFVRLMERNQILRSFCVFAQQLLEEELMDLTHEQRKELYVVVDRSRISIDKLILDRTLTELTIEPSEPSEPSESTTITAACKRTRKKKKAVQPTAAELEQSETAHLISELERMQLPPCRLMVEFTDDFLLGILRQLGGGLC